MHHKVTKAIFSAFFIIVSFTIGCSAQTSEQQSLKALRDLTAGGNMPSESMVKAIEDKYGNTRTGILARLLRARIRFENKDYRGAVIVLNSDAFQKLTGVGDYALWLRGSALQNDGDDAGAMAAFETLLKDFPNSLRADNSKILWSASALRTGRAGEVPAMLTELRGENSAEAYLATANAYQAGNDQANAIINYRKAFLYGGSTVPGKVAEAKLTAMGASKDFTDADDLKVAADNLMAVGPASVAYDTYTALLIKFPELAKDPQVHINRLKSAISAKKMTEAKLAFDAMPSSFEVKDNAYAMLVRAYAANRMWPQAKALAQEMREKFPKSPLLAGAWVDAGETAQDQKNYEYATYFLMSAMNDHPNAVEVAGAQFELAWIQHEAKNYTQSSKMLIEHLARYTDRDTSNRGKAGYWAARDSERAGKTAAACELYEATAYRYGANWYGYLALERLGNLLKSGSCKGSGNSAGDPTVAKAAANLRLVTVAAETAGEYELKRGEKAEELSTIGLFDWAIDELKEAKKTADNSPTINLSLAKYYRLKGDNVNALLSLAKSYPDYAQMFPEEMSREEWDIFYPLINWGDIKYWSGQRNLDPYLVCGIIRQESIFNPRVRSGANAYGLMQLLPGTAKLVARKYGSTADLSSPTNLYQPTLNIELGTGYMRDQLDKFGRVEYMAAAYNAGPGRIPGWRASLPIEMDEFVEAIPFRETRGYVQGVTRNTAQYRRLYDENGNFKPNVGTKPLRSAIDTQPRDQFTAKNPDISIDSNRSGE